MSTQRKPTHTQLARLEQVARRDIVHMPNALSASLDLFYDQSTGRRVPAPVMPPLIAAGWVNDPAPPVEGRTLDDPRELPVTLTDAGAAWVAGERRWAPYTAEERAVIVACRSRRVDLDGRQRFYENRNRWHDWSAQVADLTAAGLITPGAEGYELTAAGHALLAPLTEAELAAVTDTSVEWPKLGSE